MTTLIPEFVSLEMKRKNILILILPLSLYFSTSTFAEKIIGDKGNVKRYLSADGLEHGMIQVKQMLKDRPMMHAYTDAMGERKLVTEEDTIWQWAMKKFAGEDLSDTVDWNSVSSNSDRLDASNAYPDKTGRGYIWINEIYAQDIGKRGEAMSFEDLWVSAAYELINIGNADEFNKLVEEACLGDMTKQEWVEKGTKIEFKTTQKMKEFFQYIWLPWAKKNNFILQREGGFSSYLDVPDSYDEMIKNDAVTKGANFKYWADIYDSQIVPYLKAVGRYKE